jgi:uncharacterized protein (TIGR03118 family)
MKRFKINNWFYVIMTTSVLWGCQKTVDQSKRSAEISSVKISTQNLKDFQQVNLVGDNDEYNPAHIDGSLINAWGISFPASGPAWVTSQGGAVSEIYSGDGSIVRPPVTIPSLTGTSGGHPTGIVINTTAGFKLPNGSPARFIFAEAEGLISGWNGGNAAVKMSDDAFGEFYFGLALASDNGNSYLYAANFSKATIDVYDNDWKKISMPFNDPELPAGFAPFNVKNIDGKLFVMYAKIGTKPGEIVAAAPGNGIVDIFNPDGSFIKRFASSVQLNAPWGITKTPGGFWGNGTNEKDIILVGNFGDGHINAFSTDGDFQGQLREHGNPIIIERLWGLEFAPSTSTSFDHNRLYFAAGPGGEKHGLFGYISK